MTHLHPRRVAVPHRSYESPTDTLVKAHPIHPTTGIGVLSCEGRSRYSKQDRSHPHRASYHRRNGIRGEMCQGFSGRRRQPDPDTFIGHRSGILQSEGQAQDSLGSFLESIPPPSPRQGRPVLVSFLKQSRRGPGPITHCQVWRDLAGGQGSAITWDNQASKLTE
jgi:hypothetical protein